MAEGEGSSEMKSTIVETSSSSIDSSIIFHIVNDILAFSLFMHQQIPSILQDMTFEFDELRSEYKILVSQFSNSLASSYNLQTVSGFMRCTFPLMGEFSLGNSVEVKLQKAFRKGCSLFAAIRELISRGAGSNSYAGPTKLFLLVKAPSSFNMPLLFLPKRDFKCNKKILPFKLQVRCKIREAPLEVHVQKNEPRTASSLIVDSSSNDMIWFLCRHVIRGLPSRATPADE
ncbi:hypothetical protein LIER_33336 [Lithospermum erythrorhizon]|uniref:Uncharacterized protein n=1 Tax=Lithospermum erythrorhizon TaxID=34254 RepID=A0AAV3RWI0_LITER